MILKDYDGMFPEPPKRQSKSKKANPEYEAYSKLQPAIEVFKEKALRVLETEKLKIWKQKMFPKKATEDED